MDTDPVNLENYAPLKRNHACLACRRRKIKCDGTKPHCSPCLRSHAHALRAAQRAGSKLPVFSCEWAEVDDENDSSPEQREVDASLYAGKGQERRRSSGDNASGVAGPSGTVTAAPARTVSTDSGPSHRKHPTTGNAGAPSSAGNAARKAGREKEKRQEEEKEILLARIADLESKLAAMSSPSSNDNPTASSTRSIPRAGVNGMRSASASTSASPMEEINYTEQAQRQTWANVPTVAPMQNNHAPALLTSGDPSFDFSSFLMIPLHWPRNLPPPYLLEHLLDTFFTLVPSVPRMIHRGTLMNRLRLVPTHDDFPHPALLHAICACAGNYTAWVNSLPPETIEDRVQDLLAQGSNLEDIPDFSLAQAEAAQRAIHQTSHLCTWGPGRKLMDVLQAQVLMSEVYCQRGFTMLGWTLSATPIRLVQGLELTNRNVVKRAKMGILPAATSTIEREERLATVWQTYIVDAFFAVGSYWQPSVDERTFACRLPASAHGFVGGHEYIEENPQGPNDSDLYTSHPVPDPFVLMCKAAILAMRSARWRSAWAQRKIIEGDEMLGMQEPDFQQLVRDIYEFQSTMPLAIKNIFKMLDSGAGKSAFDANLLAVHVIPQITLLMLYEGFADWKQPNSVAVMQMQRAYESIVGVVHLIPSNLDLSLIMNSMMCYSLYVAGRIIAEFTAHALERQAFSLAVRHRADLMAIQGLLKRYGAKSAMGIFISGFLENYLSQLTKGQTPDMCPRPERPKPTPPATAFNPNPNGGPTLYSNDPNSFVQSGGGFNPSGISPSTSNLRTDTTPSTSASRSPADAFNGASTIAQATGSLKDVEADSGTESTGMTPFLNLDTPDSSGFEGIDNGFQTFPLPALDQSGMSKSNQSVGHEQLDFVYGNIGMSLSDFDPIGYARTLEMMQPLPPLSAQIGAQANHDNQINHNQQQYQNQLVTGTSTATNHDGRTSQGQGHVDIQMLAASMGMSGEDAAAQERLLMAALQAQGVLRGVNGPGGQGGQRMDAVGQGSASGSAR